MKLLLEANRKRTEGKLLAAAEIYERFLNQIADPAVMHILAITYFKLYLQQSHNATFGQKATYWINQAIALDPQQPQFYVTRGQIFGFGVVDAPDYKQAVQDYKMALRINPNLVVACMGLASLEGTPEEVVSLKEAIAVVEHASVIDPDNSLVWLRLGTLYYQNGQMKLSFIAYRRVLLCSKPVISQVQAEIMQYLDDNRIVTK
jgi:tetratricopeptide (TPR) repeat protein